MKDRNEDYFTIIPKEDFETAVNNLREKAKGNSAFFKKRFIATGFANIVIVDVKTIFIMDMLDMQYHKCEASNLIMVHYCFSKAANLRVFLHKRQLNNLNTSEYELISQWPILWGPLELSYTELETIANAIEAYRKSLDEPGDNK